jgi:hypothetical protein
LCKSQQSKHILLYVNRSNTFYSVNSNNYLTTNMGQPVHPPQLELVHTSHNTLKAKAGNVQDVPNTMNFNSTFQDFRACQTLQTPLHQSNSHHMDITHNRNHNSIRLHLLYLHKLLNITITDYPINPHPKCDVQVDTVSLVHRNLNPVHPVLSVKKECHPLRPVLVVQN